MKPDTLPLIITVDVCDGAYDSGDRRARFSDLLDGVPLLASCLRDTLIETVISGDLKVTWFVRADMQVGHVLGSASGLLTGWKSLWAGLVNEGGEIGWHPHLYEERDGRWLPIRDNLKMRHSAERIWNEVKNDADLKCVRMGEAVGSNELTEFMDGAGIEFDSSAVPGRRRDDPDRFFDWTCTPEDAYYPSIADYRIPSNDGVSRKLLEIPFSMGGIVAPYDEIPDGCPPYRRYIDLSYDPGILENALSGSVAGVSYMLPVIHVMQASGAEVPPGRLVQGGFDVVSENLKMLIRQASMAGRDVRLMTVSEYGNTKIAL